MRVRLLVLGFLCLGAFSGCGNDGRLNIKGRVVSKGAALKLADKEFVRVTFFPVTTNGRPPANTYIAAYEPDDGTFEAVGRDGKGIPPGKYRVAIELNNSKRRDVLKGVYDGDRSPFVFDVDANTKDLVLDLDKAPTK
jgi:hypothetical protein